MFQFMLRGRGNSKLEMATSMFRSSILREHRVLLPLSQLTLNFETLQKRKTWLSCSPSESNPVRLEVSFCVGTHLIPHPDKIDRGGEDALFVSGYNGGVLAIADGVSGWAEENVDPAQFPQELMANVSNILGNEEVSYDPQILLKNAHASTSCTGSATVIVAMLERNGILKIANVGDCGLRFIREGQIIYSTTPQEHYFDCPYQLSSEVIGQTYLDAAVTNLEVTEGDIIVMGSDGLFDNVFDQEIVSTITSVTDVEEAAKALASLANNHSRDSNFDSPYSLEAQVGGMMFHFGKKFLG